MYTWAEMQAEGGFTAPIGSASQRSQCYAYAQSQQTNEDEAS